MFIEQMYLRLFPGLENKFSFRDEKLEVILKKIARWYGVEVFYEESALA